MWDAHFVLHPPTLEILLIRAEQINVILILTLNRNLFESTSENKVAPSGEWQ